MNEKTADVKPLIVEWGVASRALPGEIVSGDAWIVQPFPGGMLLGVIDGLGHGSEATAAAETATAVLARHAGAPVGELVDLCHEALRSTRGAVVSLASFHEADSTVTWIGVGNVVGALLRPRSGAAPQRREMLLRGGVVGFQLSATRPEIAPVEVDDVLVFATDGIENRFLEDIPFGKPPQQCADQILERYARLDDDALVLVARFHGG